MRSGQSCCVPYPGLLFGHLLAGGQCPAWLGLWKPHGEGGRAVSSLDTWMTDLELCTAPTHTPTYTYSNGYWGCVYEGILKGGKLEGGHKQRLWGRCCRASSVWASSLPIPRKELPPSSAGSDCICISHQKQAPFPQFIWIPQSSRYGQLLN